MFIKPTLILTTAVLLFTPSLASASPKPAEDKGPTELVQLTHVSRFFAAPSLSSAVVDTVSNVTPITGETTTLPVVQSSFSHHKLWFLVRLPGRPNSHTGWIEGQYVNTTMTPWAVVVHLNTREVSVFNDGKRVKLFHAIVGKASTPTPTGNFYVEEDITLTTSDPGYPYALALSARSNVYTSFDGGPGQIALHGTGGLAGSLGEAASHGCTRLSAAAITWMVYHISPGTPVTIIA